MIGLSGDRGPGFAERLLHAVAVLLAAVIGLTLAVELLKAIWLWLLGGIALGCTAYATLVWSRWRSRGW